MSSKIEKIITRLQSKITEGQFYEAQQQTRVVASRYIKAKDWPAAIDILYNVASSLLKAEQGGSGGDLSIFLVDVYKQAELVPDAANKGKLLTLLRLFDPEEPTRKKFITEMIGWSAKFGSYPAGEPELHHVIGSLYASEHDVYDAERHLLLGTKESPPLLANLEYDWYATDDSHTVATYAARAVLPYLLLGNVRDASTALQLFTSRLASSNPTLAVQDVKASKSGTKVYPSIPLLNFLTLLVVAVEKGAADLFRQLKSHYASHIKEATGWDEALESIAEMYFGISRPRQGNPLFDMMGSMFGAPQAPKKQPKRVGAASGTPAAEGLD
ncbi:hypothetical protein V496_09446 [Pseudogymnoascus sp. VKM F-4515 (FW-2607)]|nr:hypothetical protein V496_09446 [Pseudogymnoascus sp. VKM F-4515 (FW-2607)]